MRNMQIGQVERHLRPPGVRHAAAGTSADKHEELSGRCVQKVPTPGRWP
jgi:hypothetical protein